MKTLLEVKDLCKTYIVNKRQINVLKNVNFTVCEGEMVVIMGPSGSGKSTLLYTVSGMDAITAGDAVFEGRSLKDLSQKELAQLRLDEMGFIFQQMYMLKNLTVLDNIILPAVQSKKLGETKKEPLSAGKALCVSWVSLKPPIRTLPRFPVVNCSEPASAAVSSISRK